MKAPPLPLLPAVGLVVVFWWTVLSVWAWWEAGEGWPMPSGWMPMLRNLLICWALGAAAAILLRAADAYGMRWWKLASLKGETWRDIHWSIGRAPVRTTAPQAVRKYRADTSELALPEEVRRTPWEVGWEARVSQEGVTRPSHPEAYINLMQSIWRVLDYHRHVPAGAAPAASHTDAIPLGLFHRLLFALVDWRSLPGWMLTSLRQQARDAPKAVKPRHGSFTLFEHSYITAWAMASLAPTWSYEKAAEVWRKCPGTHRMRDRDKFDKSYEFDPDDPLIPILGLAHDLGKFQVYEEFMPGVWESNGKKHALLSSRALSSLDAWWPLSDTDKRATTAVLESYHEPCTLPRKLVPDREDDRNFCLTMLLVQADRLALKLQRNSDPVGRGEDTAEDTGEGSGEADADTSADGVAGAAGSPSALTPLEEEHTARLALAAALCSPGRVTRANASHSLGQRASIDIVRRDGEVTEAEVVIVALGPTLKHARASLSPEHRVHFDGLAEREALLHAIERSLTRDNLLVRALPGLSLNATTDAWAVSWAGNYSGDDSIVVPEAPSLILLAGGPFLHLGEGDDTPGYPLEPRIRITHLTPSTGRPRAAASVRRGGDPTAPAARGISHVELAASRLVYDWLSQCDELATFEQTASDATGVTYRVPHATATRDPRLAPLFDKDFLPHLEAGRIPFCLVEPGYEAQEPVLVIHRGAALKRFLQLARS